MYARGCALNSGVQAGTASETVAEVAALRGALAGKLAEVRGSIQTEGRAPSLANLWLGQDEIEAAVTALGPKLKKTAVALEKLLAEVVTLEVSCPTFV